MPFFLSILSLEIELLFVAYLLFFSLFKFSLLRIMPSDYPVFLNVAIFTGLATWGKAYTRVESGRTRVKNVLHANVSLQMRPLRPQNRHELSVLV